MQLRRLGLCTLPLLATAWQIERHWTVRPKARLDFHIYYGAVAAMSHSSLYDFKCRIFPLGFTYPPLAALLLRPLTLMHESVAEHTWLIVSALMTAAFAALLVSVIRVPLSFGEKALAATAMIVAMPVTLTLRLGQINALIAVLLALDVVLMQRGTRAGGVLTGLAAAIKLTPALIVPALLIAGRTKDAARATIVGIAFTAIAATFAPHDTWRYFTSVVYDTRRVGRGGQFNDSLRRIVDVKQLEQGWRVWIVLVALVVIATVVGLRRAARRGDVVEIVTLTMLCSYLVSPITWGHHLYFCGPAVLLLWCRRTISTRVLAVAGLYLLIDPLEGGEGTLSAALRIAFMAVTIVTLVVVQPRTARVEVEAPVPVPVRAPLPSPVLTTQP